MLSQIFDGPFRNGLIWLQGQMGMGLYKGGLPPQKDGFTRI